MKKYIPLAKKHAPLIASVAVALAIVIALAVIFTGNKTTDTPYVPPPLDVAALPNINDPAPPVQMPLEGPRFAFPESLLVDNAPLDPLCFAGAEKQEDKGRQVFRLVGCQEGLVLDAGRPDWIANQPAAVGKLYHRQGQSVDTGVSPSFAAFRYIGPYQDGEVLLVETGDMRTAVFSTLYVFKREGDLLVVQGTLAGGDRCDGGVIEATLAEDDGSLIYEVLLTPHNFMTLIGPENGQARSYEGLDDSPNSCYGRARYRNGALEEVLVDESIGIRLREQNTTTIAGSATTPQQCFDALLSAWVDKHNIRISPKNLRKFTASFDQGCPGQ